MAVPYARDRSIFRSSYNSSVGTSETTIWPKNTAYSFPSSAGHMMLYSSSTADTTQLVLIDGLDANYEEISEVLMLNGQTGRETLLEYLRINAMTVLTDSPQGNISLGTGTATAGVPTNTYGYIHAGDNITNAAVYTVPAGYTLRLASGSISAGGSTGSQTVTAKFRSRINGVTYLTANISIANNYQFFPYNPPLDLPEKTDVYNNVFTSSNTSSVSATFNGWLVKNNIVRN
jgi:hypothetical protein